MPRRTVIRLIQRPSRVFSILHVHALTTTLPVIWLVAALSASAYGQLTESDIEVLRERGRIEGWTFEVKWNEACQYPLEDICGAVQPIDGEEPPSEPPPDFTTRSLPSIWDWRQHNGCTPIRNQGGCGSCWAFAAIGAVESALLINEGWNLNLSEQWLVSCTQAGDCNGGWHTSALAHLTCTYRDTCGNCGPVAESQFPYVAWNAPCGCPYSHPWRIDGWRHVGGDLMSIERIKQAIYEYGPVAVTVAADNAFQAYGGGVFNACTGTTVNHAVVLVGWNDNLGSNGCWILRNSWGSWWGDGGYMYIPYGCSRVGGSAALVEYRFDCNRNGIPDEDEIAGGLTPDCNGNGVPDECDIARHRSTDCNNNGVPDECEIGRSARLYVDRNADGNNSGMSWADALTDLEAAYCFTETNVGVTEVWVARGVYTPCDVGEQDRTRAFRLSSGVAYYGGFAGNETQLAQRNLSDSSNRTILSGDLLGDDLPGLLNREDNSYHVLICDSFDSTAVLDGFIITGGHADGPGTEGMGGGIYNYKGSPTIRNCIFVENYAMNYGGGLCSQWLWQGMGEARPTLINCVFTGNKAEAGGGASANLGTILGPVYTRLINCTLSGNVTGRLGGGIYAEGNGAAILENSILWGNVSATGMPLINQFFGNCLADYCCIQGWVTQLSGTGNTAANPQFVDQAGPDGLVGTLDDDLRLRAGSPAIDSADNARVPSDIVLDLASQPRFHDDPGMPDRGNAAGAPAIVDMGAFEFQGQTCFGDLNGDNRVTIIDLSTLLGNYGAGVASYAEGDLDGNGTVDLADLGALLGVYGHTCE